MKPDKIVCRNCGKQIDRGTWCSDKCRMAYKRKGEQEEPNKPEQEQPEQASKPEQMEPEQKAEQTLRETLTKTDKTFYDRAMKDFKEPYYKFGEMEVRSGVCGQCGAGFKTTLGLNRYCSYAHYHESLGVRH